MNLNKIFENFIEKTTARSPYSKKEDIKEITLKMLDIIEQNKDKTPEELVEKVIEDDINNMEILKDKYLIPGYTIGINVGNINVEYFGGNIDAFERKMPKDAMFDIASMTKMYTQVILYNLIKEGAISLSDKVYDLDYRFTNLKDVSIQELTEFTIDLKTPGNITLMENKEDAKEALYNIEIAKYSDGNIKRGKYFYTDFGMMVLKEVMEFVTNKTYSQLVDEYIVDKLGLSHTKLIVPNSQLDLITGSPNTKLGAVNDPKANSVGGYSGHAGIFASSRDLIDFGKGIESGIIMPKLVLNKAYNKGAKANRGIMGNTYVATEDGLGSSYIETFSPNTDFAIQGSTRTQLNIGKDSISTILLNPASLSIEKAIEEENKINEMRAYDGQAPISIVKHFQYNKEGSLVGYDLIDATKTVNYRQVDPLTTMNAKTTLRLEFLNEVIKEYDKTYEKEINVSKSL